MARWRLTTGHYLNVPGTEWEYKESDRETGRSARKVFEVPLYLHPDSKADQNYPEQDMIAVSNKFDPNFRRDYVFAGPPTPDMDPLDDEAREISQGFRDRGEWKHPIETLDMNYSQSVLSDFERQIAQIVANNVPKAQPVVMASENAVSAEDFKKLQEQVAALMNRNAQLEEQVKKPVRRA